MPPSRSSGLVPVTLGLDFGSYNSKMTFSTKPKKKARAKIYRVNSSFPAGHPHHAPASAASPFEFPATANTISNDRLVVGQASRSEGSSFPLKTVMLFCAGIPISRGAGKKKISGARKLIQAIKTKKVTRKDLEDALCDHFATLREAAIKQAKELGFDIVAHVITYPNYLCSEERSGDFDKYITYYVHLLERVWPEIKCIETVSEGQAAAIHATDVYDDPIFRTDSTSRHKLFEAFGSRSSLMVLIADGGSSSLNLQAVDVYFDKDGKFLEGQSIVGRDWLTGTEGGSHNANDGVLKLLEAKFKRLLDIGKMNASELGAFVEDFEFKKRNLDFDAYVREGKYISIHGGGKNLFVIEADRLKSVFGEAFDEGLAALEEAVRKVTAYGTDFLVLLVGGSYGNPGLRSKIETHLSDVVSGAAEKGIKVKFGFLHDEEAYPTSAVSAGAALAAANMPTPTSILRQSAVGLQFMSPEDDDADQWEGEDQADFIFQPGCQELFFTDVDTRLYPGRQVDVSVVCDPRYRPLKRGEDLVFPPLRINKEAPSKTGRSARGAIYVYDLGMRVALSKMPPGFIRLMLDGSHIERLVSDRAEDSLGDEPIPMTFTCASVDGNGAPRPNRSDKRWAILMRTDPGSKLLILEEVRELPVWCTECEDELVPEAHICQHCDAIVACRQCFQGMTAQQLRQHEKNFEHVTVDTKGLRDN